jgi:twitching motility two-component system response regulator PilG
MSVLDEPDDSASFFATSDAPLAGIRVLVADDSHTVRRSAELFLTQAGCQVVLAEDGFDALTKIVDQSPDVIFCDIDMPRLDGDRACMLIKGNPRFAATPVATLGTGDNVLDQARGRVAGADMHLGKPFSQEDLVNAVAALTGRSKLAESA